MKKSIINICKKKAIIYIDGFNLYTWHFKQGNHHKWLDLYSLSSKLIPQNYLLTQVKYFTSRIQGDVQKHNRQANYIHALECHLGSQLSVIFGRFQLFPSHCKKCGAKPVFCSSCNFEYSKPNEKKTDVNISTAMFTDCIERKVDLILLISGDSDYEITLDEIAAEFEGSSAVPKWGGGEKERAVGIAGAQRK